MHSFDKYLLSASCVLGPVLCIGFAVELIPRGSCICAAFSGEVSERPERSRQVMSGRGWCDDKSEAG